MLHTAQIIIPKRDNDGSDNSYVVERTIRAFCRSHGGCTVVEGKGFWVSPEGKLFEDAVVIVMAAMTRDETSRTRLRSIAADVLGLTDQEAVFVSHADGEVEIIPRA